VADSFAGFVAAQSLHAPDGAQSGTLAAAAAASMCAYWLGMAANDLFDRRKDAEHAPRKPLPSGRMTLRAARAACVTLGAAAMAFGFLCGAPLITAALLATALLYDAGGKNFPIAGNLIMGACRSGNFLLGASASMGTEAALSQPPLLLGSAFLGLFIAAVTAVSRLEDAPFDRTRFFRAAAPILIVPIVLLVPRPGEICVVVNALLLAWLLTSALRSAIRAGKASSPHAPHGAAVFVRNALGGIFFVDAGVVLLLAATPDLVVVPVIVLYGLFALAWIWKRRWIRAGAAGS
jgi:hypothetical protein